MLFCYKRKKVLQNQSRYDFSVGVNLKTIDVTKLFFVQIPSEIKCDKRKFALPFLFIWSAQGNTINFSVGTSQEHCK